MNVIELFELARWYKLYFKPMQDLYNTLHSALSNNASQPTLKVQYESFNRLS